MSQRGKEKRRKKLCRRSCGEKRVEGETCQTAHTECIHTFSGKKTPTFLQALFCFLFSRSWTVHVNFTDTLYPNCVSLHNSPHSLLLLFDVSKIKSTFGNQVTTHWHECRSAGRLRVVVMCLVRVVLWSVHVTVSHAGQCWTWRLNSELKRQFACGRISGQYYFMTAT